MIHFLGIIPARYHSSRFPGKPLVDIAGKSMVRRVYEQASSLLEQVVVATDDPRIETAVMDFGGNVFLTSPEHASGTDRCAEALEMFIAEHNRIVDVVLNIQGDEPFIQPEQIQHLMTCFNDPSTQIATLAKVIEYTEELNDPNITKVVCNLRQEALYFSRSPLPYIRGKERSEWIRDHRFLKHIGMYAYQTDILREITRLTPSELELAESLEQNRWLENGYRIHVKTTEYDSFSIDTPADLEKIVRQQKK
jgi:3-deoxy-manno-octulosonate cytidylyltransferase (CMP-KDO synthetase)